MSKISKKEAEKYFQEPPIILRGRSQDLAGEIFGRLTVIKPVGKNKFNKIINLCICSCGKFTIVASNSLKYGKSSSCGCYRKEQSSIICKDSNFINKRSDSKRKAKKENSLGSKYPESIERWDYEKNFPLTPYDVNYCSNKPKRWFICDKGHSFDTSCHSFSKGHRCRYCSGREVLIGFNIIDY